MPDDDRPDPTDRRPLGERPATNGAPFGASVRDAPARAPRPTRALLAEAAPFLLLAAVVVLVLAGR
ncbi:hypothetical protein MHY85_05755 [Cellulomonas sp. ACRRI]|uniref:hypothetical protein n=1 Tax=Cellulomonas sp. ACRRI TaxID=2918188 RepID=UPI001EF22FB7|nr:hypothetical protein [Cellulomonas sp. ACRRI]MCG7285481.1 hypothetical protein [Cellulomonas sp. ACRRI]